MIVFYIAIMVAGGIICYKEAQRKHRDATTWAIFGALLPIPAVIIIYLLDTVGAKCAYCRKSIAADATVCPYCTREQPKRDTPDERLKTINDLAEAGDKSVAPRLVDAFENAVRTYRPAVPGLPDFPERNREYEVLKALAQALIRVGDSSLVPRLTGLRHEKRNADRYLVVVIDEAIKGLETKQDRFP